MSSRMPEMEYHVFRKPVKGRSGRPVHRWYYYWIDAAGKQRQKACRGCKNRAEAENYIRTLAPPPDTALAAGERPVTVREIAETMYIPGSAHINRRIQLGREAVIETLNECRRLTRRIIELWGDLPHVRLLTKGKKM